MSPTISTWWRAERRAAPKPARASRGTRLAFETSMRAQARTEPRLSLRSGHRPMSASDERQS
jgi:hypothetical protein